MPTPHYPQTGYLTTYDGPQAGDCWRIAPGVGAPPTRLVAANAWGVQSLVMVFTLALNGTAAGLVIDGATFTTNATTLEQLIAGLAAYPAFDATVSAGPVEGDATKVRFVWSDHATHTVTSPNARLTNPTTVIEASGDQYLEPGMGAAYRDDNGIARPSTMDDVLFGVVLRTGLPSATEAIAKGGREGQWPVGTMPYVERRDEAGVTVPCTTAATQHAVAYWICTGPHAGKFRADDGGRGLISDITLTSNAADKIGFSVDGLPAVQVTSVNGATDLAGLIAAFNGRDDMGKIGFASSSAGKVRINFSDRIAHIVTNASTGTASTSAADFQTAILGTAKPCLAAPRITFATDLDAPGTVNVEIG